MFLHCWHFRNFLSFWLFIMWRSRPKLKWPLYHLTSTCLAVFSATSTHILLSWWRVQICSSPLCALILERLWSLWEYDTKNHTEKSNHAETPLKPYWKLYKRSSHWNYHLYYTELCQLVLLFKNINALLLHAPRDYILKLSTLII